MDDVETTTEEPIPTETAATPEETDDLVVYLIVNTDLNMGVGKIAAQAGHAVQYLMQRRDEILAGIDLYYGDYCERDRLAVEHALAFNEWCEPSKSSKIVKGANAKEFEKVKTDEAARCVIVRDAGKTEIPSGSETVIGVYPMRKSETPKLIRRLRLLK